MFVILKMLECPPAPLEQRSTPRRFPMVVVMASASASEQRFPHDRPRVAGVSTGADIRRPRPHDPHGPKSVAEATTPASDRRGCAAGIAGCDRSELSVDPALPHSGKRSVRQCRSLRRSCSGHRLSPAPIGPRVAALPLVGGATPSRTRGVGFGAGASLQVVAASAASYSRCRCWRVASSRRRSDAISYSRHRRLIRID